MDAVDFCSVYVTAPNSATAAELANGIVQKRLAACANVIGGAWSVYWWHGELEQADEMVVVFKTRGALVPALTRAIQAMHPYECPCIAALPIVGGSRSYLDWIASVTATASDD